MTLGSPPSGIARQYSFKKSILQVNEMGYDPLSIHCDRKMRLLYKKVTIIELEKSEKERASSDNSTSNKSATFMVSPLSTNAQKRLLDL